MSPTKRAKTSVERPAASCVSSCWNKPVPFMEQAPKAVATLQRNFEQTIAISALGGIARELVRTTSLLERTNRELRRKFRQACCFSSRRGAEVAIYLQVQRLHARWTKRSWARTARLLSLAFY